MTKVLIAYDGSAQSQRALRWADRLRPDDEVAVISVAHSLIEGPRTAAFTDPTSDPGEHRRLLEEARALLAGVGAGAEVETIDAIGNPASEILEVAERRGIELIVIGRTGRGAVHRFVMGSVADRVARHAPCDVLVVR